MLSASPLLSGFLSTFTSCCFLLSLLVSTVTASFLLEFPPLQVVGAPITTQVFPLLSLILPKMTHITSSRASDRNIQTSLPLCHLHEQASSYRHHGMTLLVCVCVCVKVPCGKQSPSSHMSLLYSQFVKVIYLLINLIYS